jgi:hypothetical protein
MFKDIPYKRKMSKSKIENCLIFPIRTVAKQDCSLSETGEIEIDEEEDR